jgi:hypothetical protein
MNFQKILTDAFATPVSPAITSGCGRVYVWIGKKDRRKICNAARKIGKKFLIGADAGHLNGCLYVGYDNNDGTALARGTIVADALKAVGVECYRDEYGD